MSFVCVILILRDMCSHCGECFCFGVAKLARVLLFYLVCFLVLGLVLFFFVLVMVAVCSLFGGGFLLVWDIMSSICCLITCNLEGFSLVFFHFSG
jgi:hypothetical protein